VTITVTFTGVNLADIKGQINEFMGAPSARPLGAGPAESAGHLPTVSPKETRDTSANAEPSPTSGSPEEPTAQTDATIPYETVRDAVLRLALAKGKPRVMELLNEFGAQKKADEIDPARYGEVLETINKILEA